MLLTTQPASFKSKQVLNGKLHLELALHLTLNRVDFFFPSPKVVVLDLVGVSSATLVLLLHYAEIPVPTSISQGAFSISCLNIGLPSRTDVDASLLHFKVSRGRISALHSVPVQIKWTDIQSYCEPTIEESNIDKWLRTEFSGSSPQKVLSISEDRTLDWYLQFHVPQKLEASFPKEANLGGKKFLVEQARPYAPAHSTSSCPLLKKACMNIGRKPSQKKDRSNCCSC